MATATVDRARALTQLEERLYELPPPFETTPPLHLVAAGSAQLRRARELLERKGWRVGAGATWAEGGATWTDPAPTWPRPAATVADCPRARRLWQPNAFLAAVVDALLDDDADDGGDDSSSADRRVRTHRRWFRRSCGGHAMDFDNSTMDSSLCSSGGSSSTDDDGDAISRSDGATGSGGWIEHGMGGDGGGLAVDVGCGSGRDAVYLALKLGPRWKVLAVDNHRAALARTRALAEREGVGAQVRPAASMNHERSASGGGGVPLHRSAQGGLAARARRSANPWASLLAQAALRRGATAAAAAIGATTP
eukprot:scaffold3111_cov332-Prasinococcus_capsulatus_cf.AAC.17